MKDLSGNQLFDVTKTQGEAKIQPNGVTDDFGGIAMAGVRIG